MSLWLQLHSQRVASAFQREEVAEAMSLVQKGTAASGESPMASQIRTAYPSRYSLWWRRGANKEFIVFIEIFGFVLPTPTGFSCCYKKLADP